MTPAGQSRVSPSLTADHARGPFPAHVLLVSPDAYRARRWSVLFLMRSFAVTAVSPERSLHLLAARDGFHVILLDLADTCSPGLSLCRQFRAAGVITPVLVVQPQGGQMDLLDAFDAGADAYLCGHVQDAELLRQIGGLCRRQLRTAGGDGRALTVTLPASR